MIIVLLFIMVIGALTKQFDPKLDKSWEKYRIEYNKKYPSKDEEQTRRAIWEANLNLIEKHNLEADQGKYSFHLGINHLADMTTEECTKLKGLKLGNLRDRSTRPTFVPKNLRNLPKTLDWRKKGLVTPVKDQGQCGSCWAFSTTGTIEGQHKKKTGKLVSLSEQNLIDCSKDEGNKGCNGGNEIYAFDYILKNKGIGTEASYPYEAKDKYTCRFNRSSIGATITGYKGIPKGDEKVLMEAVATIGPISVGIDANGTKFFLYKEGIHDDENCGSTDLDLNHAGLVVGYGTQNGKDYWIVKNSWGEGWGDKGYIKMARNAKNQCGIATEASYPLV